MGLGLAGGGLVCFQFFAFIAFFRANAVAGAAAGAFDGMAAEDDAYRHHGDDDQHDYECG